VSDEQALRFTPEVVLRPPFGDWHDVGDGWQVRVLPTDDVGTIRVRRAPAEPECGRRQDGTLMCRPWRKCPDCPLSGITAITGL
jgi:hypothetical protein